MIRNVHRFALYFILAKQMVKHEKLTNRMIGKCVELHGAHPNESMKLKLHTARPIDSVLLVNCGLRDVNPDMWVGFRTYIHTLERADDNGIVWNTFQEKATIENMVEVHDMMGDSLFNESLAGLALSEWYDVKYV